MAGKKGMSKGNMGGSRTGAGRKRKSFPVSADEHFIMERETIGGEIQPPQMWRVLSVSRDEIEFQCGDDIIVIRRLDTE